MYFAGSADFNEETRVPLSKFNRSTFIFASTCVLAICSIIATAVAASLLPGGQIQYSAGVAVCQVLALAVSSVSFLYLGFYLVAVRGHVEVGTTRPSIRKLHTACFITIRLATVLWLGFAIASIVISFQKNICSKGVLICRLEKLDVAISITAFLSSAMILWCFRTSSRSSRTLKSLPVRSKASSRASTINNILDRSVPRACDSEPCSPDYEKRYNEPAALEKECNTIPATHPSLQKKSSLKYSISSAQIQKVPGAFPAECNKRSSDSLLSTWSGSSDFDGYSGITYINPQRPKRARPASSISDSTRKSPLSTIRYVNFPSVAIGDDLRYPPPNNSPVPSIPLAHQWNLYQSQPQPHILYHSFPFPLPGYIGPAPLLPIANPPCNSQYMLNRRPSAMVRPLIVRKPTGELKINAATPSKLSRKNTVDLKVPGAFEVEPHSDVADENKVEEGIEKENVTGCYVPRAVRANEGEGVAPTLRPKIETFFDEGRVFSRVEVGIKV